MTKARREPSRALALEQILTDIGPVAVAVSGGVDSMTLAHVAHRVLGDGAEMFHAQSAAVPAEATERVRRHAAEAGWRLHIVDAGETADERYVANPVDRCFFCKTNLYSHIGQHTDKTMVSGTNVDDLGDYRPGLQAAAEHDVRHPFVEAGIDKQAVRALAAAMDLGDLAELPAAPCLSSRIETGIRVTPRRLSTVETVERFLRSEVDAENVRCRIRAGGIVIEIDESAVTEVEDRLAGPLSALMTDLGVSQELRFEPYRRGTAFLRQAGA